MKRLNRSDIRFRRLFDVKKLPQMESFVAISENGELLYVTEGLAGMTMTYCERMIFRLERDEFRDHLERAKRRGKLKKAAEKGYLTETESEWYCKQYLL